MSHTVVRWLGRLTLLIAALLASTGRAAEKFSRVVEETYARHKADVLSKFTDSHGLVVELRDGKSAGIGDAAWRTGLAALCFALERDDASTQKYLKSLAEKCWKDGKPIRHPDSKETGAKTYSRDQFFPQMTACLFAHEYGNRETKKLAQQLYGQFIKKIRDDDWVLNEGEAAEIELQNRFPVVEVPKQLDLFAGPKLKNADGHLTRKAFVSPLQLKSLELANPDTVKLFNSDKETFQFYGVHLLFHESLATI